MTANIKVLNKYGENSKSTNPLYRFETMNDFNEIPHLYKVSLNEFT